MYAIYRKKGYELRITKAVTGDGKDPDRAFTVVITSNAITESSYPSEGTGYSTVSAQDHTITLTIKDGGNIVIKKLAEGDYTISETGVGFVMTGASISGTAQTVSGNAVTIHLENNTRLDVTNDMPLPSPTGYSERTAPYAWMLALGLALLAATVWYRRRRRGEE